MWMPTKSTEYQRCNDWSTSKYPNIHDNECIYYRFIDHIESTSHPTNDRYRNEQFPVIAIVTISDRAYAGIYPDQSGPMIANTIRSVPGIPSDLQFIMNMIVPDDMAAIEAKIRTICDNGWIGIASLNFCSTDCMPLVPLQYRSTSLRCSTCSHLWFLVSKWQLRLVLPVGGRNFDIRSES